jgi:hypothetical protein
MVNKKGQEMSVATLVLIVIGIVVLVMLILGFSMGWQNLWGKINIFGGGSNVETVVQSCKLAASSDSVFSYCSEFKKVTINGDNQYINCEAPQVQTTGLDKTLTCTSSLKERAKSFCGNQANSTIVNGQTCEYWKTVPASSP